MSPALRILVRAASLIAVALAGWANNVRWGTSSCAAGRPRSGSARGRRRAPVGAGGLRRVAGHASRPASRLWLRGAACLFALGVAAIALHLRSARPDLKLPDLVAGPGWMWLAAGAGLSLAAALGSFAAATTSR